MLKCRRELCPHSSANGISLIALIITIVIIIILAVIILGVASNTPEKAKLATFISDISEIQQGVETKKATNYMPSADGTFDVNKGFTKITIKKTPYSTAEDGWVVNLDNIDIKSSTRGNDYNDVVENSQITFGEGAPDVYVYDSDGAVYYAPGFKDNENTVYSKADVTYAATGEIPRVEAENPSYWTFNSTTGVISKYTGPEVQELVIPNYISGVKVNEIAGDDVNDVNIIASYTTIKNVIISPGITRIGDIAFVENNSIENVSIPNTVTSIGDYAFTLCTNLETLNIPSSVNSIGYLIVGDCQNLREINVDPNNYNYKSIDGVLFNKSGSTLFAYPCAKTGSVYDVPDGVTSLEYAFAYDATLLTTINLPDSLINIAGDAFAYCTSLTEINIPSNVNSIGKSAFMACVQLRSINVSEENQSYKSIDGVLFNKSGTLLHTYPPKRVGTSYSIPYGITTLEESAFVYATLLSTITLPSTLITIEPGVFWACSNITSITIPNGVTSIGSSAFRNCSKLTSITIPSSVSTIGSYVFYGCSKLTQIIVNKASLPGAKWGAPASTVVTWNP
jgi:type II secretory pathway pseudopilin PulG